MAYEKRDMSGTLFRNDRKEQDSHPDWAGYIVIDGKEFWLNAWEKNGSKGLFFSLAAKPKQERAAEIRSGYQGKDRDDPRTSYGSGPVDLGDDEVPFAPEFR